MNNHAPQSSSPLTAGPHLAAEGALSFGGLPRVTIGGLPIAVVDRDREADLMLDAVRRRPRRGRPLFFTSANGEVIARAARDPDLAALFAEADQIVADGQPMVAASRFVCRMRLPERVATTDLFHDVARRAEISGESMYLLGASAQVNATARARIGQAYPRLRLLGGHHGYLQGDALIDKLAEINELAPDILWLGMGVPREQKFVVAHAHRLDRVGLIKTSGGLFDFLGGRAPRAPEWMQNAGLEWAFRLFAEPKRLAWRYLTTNPAALFLILTRSR